MRGVTVTARAHVFHFQGSYHYFSGSLPDGHRFPWTTRGRDRASVLADIAPGSHDFADITVQLIGQLEEGFFASVGNGLTVRPVQEFGAGEYLVEIEIAALDPPFNAIHRLGIKLEDVDLTLTLID